jgi:hypothetical protein
VCADTGAFASIGWTSSGFTVPSTGGITVSFKSAGDVPVRLQLTAPNGTLVYTASITSGAEALWSDFTNNLDDAPPVGLPVQEFQLVIDGTSLYPTPYDVCVESIAIDQ